MTLNAPLDEWLKLVSRPAEILIVEDDENFSYMLLRVMSRYNCKPTLARDGETAIRFLKETPHYDLIILDWVLPRASGKVVLQHIYQLAPDIPVAILSGYITTEMVTQVSELGLVAMFYKPIASTMNTLDRLMRTIGIKPKAGRDDPP